MKVAVIPVVNKALATILKGLVKGLVDLENRRWVETIQTTTLLWSAKNTEKCPGDLRRGTVTQTPVKDYQLTLVYKSVKEYNNNNNNKTRHDWVGEVIHWELCKRFKFDHTNKWSMQNPGSVQENETHKLLWEFEIQTNHLISARWSDFIIINKN